MMYLEMSRDETHGGGSWAFPNCVWAPTEKSGGGSWPFWKKILDVRVGDIILHLRGVPPNAFFVGYSTASCDGFETTNRPPDPEAWSYSKKFYRADLENFVAFHKPINLSELLATRRVSLEVYFDENRTAGMNKLNVFFVRQSGRLQCLNGAYLSDVDDGLLSALFDDQFQLEAGGGKNPTQISVETGWQLAQIKTRLGQGLFAKTIKALYKNTCCFPSCAVTDPRFLVASHIARWSDNEKLRGNLGNGLCLCLMHDKAFELGLFTIDEKWRVYVNPHEIDTPSPIVIDLKQYHGTQIKLSNVLPLDEALLEHWIRVGLNP